MLGLVLWLAVGGRIDAARTDDFLANFGYQTWQTENGLPQNSVHAILQARDGYLWIGTEGGLARFDGLKFVVFDPQSTPGLRSNYIRTLLEDNTQSIWIGTTAGLTRYKDSKFTAFSTEQGLPSNDVAALWLGTNGEVWVLTAEGPAHYEKGRFSGRRWSGINGRVLTAFAQDNHKQLWIGARNDLLAMDDGGQVRSTYSLASAKNQIEALLLDRSGTLWIGTSEGLERFEGGAIRTVPLPGVLPSKRVTAVYEAPEGVIWVGTERGAIRLKHRETQRLLLPDQSLGGPVLSILQDREGNVWMGTDSGGLTVCRDRKFRTHAGGTTPGENQIRCVFQDHQGKIWAGTNGFGLQVFQGDKQSSITTRDGLSSDVILSLGETAQGELLVGTPDGINVLHRNGVEVLTSADGLPDDFIQSIYADSGDSVWIGTRRGVSHWSNGKLTNYTERDGLPSDFIGSILRRRNGELWIGTLRGAAVMKGDKFSSRPFANGITQGIVTSLHEDDAGSLWIGTGENGLARLSEGKLFYFPRELGLPNSVLGILEDVHHCLWLSSPNGLFTVSSKELDAYASGHAHAVSVLAYGGADGLRVNQFTGTGHPAEWRDHNDTLWFATARGLVSIDAKHVEPRKVAPLVAMAAVTVNDQAMMPKQVSDIPAGLTRIAFEYDGLSFMAPQRVTFRYRLQGFDKDWVDGGTRRIAYYTNLSPGRYEFQVMARNIDGVWSKSPASLRFRLEPHFYERWWFLVLLGFIAASLIYMGYRLRVRSVQAQFHAVLEERARIAREIHDTLAQSLVAVSLQLELIHRLMSHSIESAGEVLEETRQLVQDSIAEARRSIWNLRSDEAAKNDLPSRLSKMLESATANKPLNSSFQVTGAYRPLTPRAEDEVVRIGSEAITNAVRHANASKLDVTLSFDSSKACLTIVDDGQGFAVGPRLESPEGHYGLRGMLERARKINATLLVDSKAGGGTRVQLELPIQ